MQPIRAVMDVSDEILGNVKAPTGWEVVEEIDYSNIGEIQKIDKMKNKVTMSLPFVTGRVERFIDRIYRKYNIAVSEAYVFIDADAAFHIMLLVDKEDFLSPEMMGAKIQAKEFLTTTGDINMRFTFTIGDEYFKYHYSERSYKLRYEYKIAS